MSSFLSFSFILSLSGANLKINKICRGIFYSRAPQPEVPGQQHREIMNLDDIDV